MVGYDRVSGCLDASVSGDGTGCLGLGFSIWDLSLVSVVGARCLRPSIWGSG